MTADMAQKELCSSLRARGSVGARRAVRCGLSDWSGLLEEELRPTVEMLRADVATRTLLRLGRDGRYSDFDLL